MTEQGKELHNIHLNLRTGCKRKNCKGFCPQCEIDTVELYLDPKNPKLQKYLDVLLHPDPLEFISGMTATGFQEAAQEYRDKLRYNLDGIFGDGAADKAFKYGMESMVAFRLACNVRDYLEKVKQEEGG